MFNILCQAFSPSQIVISIVLSVVVAAVLAAHVFLAFYYKKKNEKKPRSLAAPTEQPPAEEEKPPVAEQPPVAEEQPAAAEDEEDKASEPEPDDEEDENDDDDEEDELSERDYEITPEMEAEAEAAAAFAADERVFNRNLRILPVCDMTEKMRTDFELTDEEYDAKRYYALYSYTFDAKLHCASEQMKEYYGAIVDELSSYKGVRVKSSAKQQRISAGRKTLGLILFRGKTLCVALAFDPADYVDTKYHGIDMSDKKRFAQTPVLFRINSRRKLGYLISLFYLFEEKFGVSHNENAKPKGYVALDAMTDGELYDEGLLRIKLKGEAPPKADENKPKPKASPKPKTEASPKPKSKTSTKSKTSAKPKTKASTKSKK